MAITLIVCGIALSFFDSFYAVRGLVFFVSLRAAIDRRKLLFPFN
jgi:hypothetical protein